MAVGPGGRDGEFRAVPALQGPTAYRAWGMLCTSLQVPFSDVMFQTAKLPVYAFLVKGICVFFFASKQQLIQ